MTTIAETKAEFKQEKKAGGCSSCQSKPQPQVSHESLDAWFAGLAAQPSDFHEHMPTLRDLAAACEHATEISRWYKSADIAIARGLSDYVAPGSLVSICPGRKPNWNGLGKFLGERFKGVVGDGLGKHQGKVRKYIVIHCTETFGEAGDVAGRPGVMHALRTFCMKHPEWVVKRRDRNNHGLMVLSKCAEDVKELPSLWRKAMNYTAAMGRHMMANRPTVSLEVLEQRQAECAVCPERALDSCAACGCPLEAKLPLATETCGLVKKGLPPKWEAVT